MLVGERLKALRKAQSLTLQQLADETGLSIGYLSNLERDRTSPTIAALFKICSVLQEDISTFLQAYDKKTHVIRKDERETTYFKASKVKFESITQKGAALKGYCITVAPGGVSGGSHEARPQAHNNDEIGIILSGSVEFMIGDETYILNEGDTLYIEANTPHHFRNTGKVDCILYNITT